jgi:hypothetical protein
MRGAELFSSLSPAPLVSRSTMSLDGVSEADVNRVADRTQAQIQSDGMLRFAEYQVDRRPRSVTGVPTYCYADVRRTAAGVSIDATYRESAFGAGWPYLYFAMGIAFGLLAIFDIDPPIIFGLLAALALFTGASFLPDRRTRFTAQAALLEAQLRQLFTDEAARSHGRSSAE